MPFARKRAVQPNQRELLFSSLPICADSPAQHPLRAATAARNCTSYRRPPAGAFAFASATNVREGIHPLRKNEPNAIPFLLRSRTRATRFARASAPFNPTDPSYTSARHRFALIHPRYTPLRSAPANRPN